MASHHPSTRQVTKKKMTKAEFKLISESLPKEIKNLSEKRIHSALEKSEELVAKYRLASRKASPTRSKLIAFRLSTLQKARDRYYKKATGRVRAKPSTREKHSLTEQPKMRLQRQDSPRDFFMRQEKEKIYDRVARTKGNRNSALRNISDRIAGKTKSQNKKGQVSRDRQKAEREQH